MPYKINFKDSLNGPTKTPFYLRACLILAPSCGSARGKVWLLSIVKPSRIARYEAFLNLAPSASSRRCSDMAAVGGTPDGQWTRPIPPLLTRNRPPLIIRSENIDSSNPLRRATPEYAIDAERRRFPDV